MRMTTSATQLAPVCVLHRAAARSAPPASPAQPARLKLVARPRAVDESVLSEVVRRYHGALLQRALALLPNRTLAEEAVQETWAAVVDGLASFEGRSSLKTWIFRILFNRAKMCLRHETRSVPFSALRDCDSESLHVDPARLPQNASWSNPEKVLMQKDAIRRLERALKGLPPRQREVVTLRVVQGLESEEVCSILGLRETNQRVLLYRARSRLRRAMEGHLIGA
jgi:RNA polymerase sigma-70 factor, ECF subfamily